MEIYKIVNAWNYFLMNFNSPGYYRDYLVEIFGAIMGSHFIGKFEYYCNEYDCTSAFVYLWADMSEGNRRKLINWVSTHYDEFKI